MGIEKTESLLDNLFVINDIDLEIPPTQITIQEEDTYWSWKTLRSKVSTKSPTSHGVLNVDLTIIFVPDQLITLHRLITEIKNSPFVYVHSRYLRQNIWSHLSETDLQAMLNMAFVVTSLDVASVQEHPGTFQMHISMRWFNYFPYSIAFRYRSDWMTMPVESSGSDYLKQFTIPTVIGKNLQADQVAVYTKNKNKNNVYSESYSVIREKVESQKSTVDLTSMLLMHAGVEYDLKPLPAPMMKASPCNPNTSNIYKRYINTLQQKSLFNNFGIDLFELFDQDEVKSKYGQSIYNSFTVGTRNSFSKDLIADAEVKAPRVVYGWHESELPDEIKGFIILKMMNLMHETTMYYEEYIKIEKDASLVDLELEIQRNQSKGIQSFYQSSLKEEAVEALGSLDSSFSEGSDLSEYTLKQKAQQKQNSIDASNKFPSAATAVGLTTPIDNFDDYVFYPLFTNRANRSGTEKVVPIDVKGVITSGFGWRWRNYALKQGQQPYWQMHTGVDFGSRDSQGRNINEKDILINSPLDGRIVQIVKAQGKTGAGRYITIKHSDTLTTRYLHLNDEQGLTDVYKDSEGVFRDPRVGDEVKRGQPFAVMGTTGGSNGIHLHFEVKVNGKTVDPVPYILGTSFDIASAEVDNSKGGNEYNKNSLKLSDDGDRLLTEMMVNQSHGNLSKNSLVSFDKNINNAGGLDVPIFPSVNYYSYNNNGYYNESILIGGSYPKRTSIDDEEAEIYNVVDAFSWDPSAQINNQNEYLERKTNTFDSLGTLISLGLVSVSYSAADLWNINLGTTVNSIDDGLVKSDLFFFFFRTKEKERTGFDKIETGSGVNSIFSKAYESIEGIIRDPWSNESDNYKTFLNKKIPTGVVLVPVEDIYFHFDIIGPNEIEITFDFSDKFKDEFFENGTSNLASYAAGKPCKKLSYDLIYSIYSPYRAKIKCNTLSETYSFVFFESCEILPIQQFSNPYESNGLNKNALKINFDALNLLKSDILDLEKYHKDELEFQSLYGQLKDISDSYANEKSGLSGSSFNYLYLLISNIKNNVDTFINLNSADIESSQNNLQTFISDNSLLHLKNELIDIDLVIIRDNAESIINTIDTELSGSSTADSVVYNHVDANGNLLSDLIDTLIETSIDVDFLTKLSDSYKNGTESFANNAAVNFIAASNDFYSKDLSNFQFNQNEQYFNLVDASWMEPLLLEILESFLAEESLYYYLNYFSTNKSLKEFSAKSFWNEDTVKIENYLNTYLPGEVSQEVFDTLFIIAWFKNYESTEFKQLMSNATSNAGVENIFNYTETFGSNNIENKYDSTKGFVEIRKSLFDLFNSSEISKAKSLSDFASLTFPKLSAGSKNWGSAKAEMLFHFLDYSIPNFSGDTEFSIYESPDATANNFELKGTSGIVNWPDYIIPIFNTNVDLNKIHIDQKRKYFFCKFFAGAPIITIPKGYIELTQKVYNVVAESNTENVAEETEAVINIVAKKAEVTPQQLNSIEALRDLIGDLMKEDWVPYVDRSGVTDVMKRVVAVSYGNPNYYNNLNFNQFFKYIDSNGNEKYQSYLKEMINSLIQYEPANLQAQESLTFYKDIVLSRVTGSLRHIVSTLPVVGHQYPTCQHLGSIEPVYELEFMRMPDPGDSYDMGESGQILSSNLSQLKLNGKKFRKVPNSHAFSLDSFITRLFGSFEETDYRSNEKNPLDVGLLKRIISKRSFSQTIPGSPGLSSFFLSLEETNPYDSESKTFETNIEDLEKPEQIETVSFKERIKDALTRLYHRQYSKDGAVLSYLNQFAEIKAGKEAIDYLSNEMNLDEDQLKEVNQIAVLSDSNFFIDLEEKFINDLIKKEALAFDLVESFSEDYEFTYTDERLSQNITLNLNNFSKEKLLEDRVGQTTPGDTRVYRNLYVYHATGEGYVNVIEIKKGDRPEVDTSSYRVLGVRTFDIYAQDLPEYFDVFTGGQEDLTLNQTKNLVYEHFASYSDVNQLQYLGNENEYSATKVVNIEQVMNSIGSPGETSVTGEIKNIDVEKYRNILIDTMREVRMNLTEEACGGIPQTEINNALFELNDLDAGIIDAARWKNFFYYSYAVFSKGVSGYFSESAEEISGFTRSQVQNINYLLGYDLIDLQSYFASLYLPGVYDNISGITNQEKENYYAALGYSSSNTTETSSNATGGSDPLDFNKVGVGISGGTAVLDTAKYSISLYDEDEKYIIQYLNSLDSGFNGQKDNALDAIFEDKSIVANFVDIFTREDDVDSVLDSVGERVNRTARFLTFDGIYARRNKLQQYMSSRENLIESYMEMTGQNFMYSNYWEEYLPNLAPMVVSKNDSSFSKNSRINKDLDSVSKVFEKLFSPRALLRNDLSYYSANTDVRRIKQKREAGVSLLASNFFSQMLETTGRNFTSGQTGLVDLGSRGAISSLSGIADASFRGAKFVSMIQVAGAVSGGSAIGTTIGESYNSVLSTVSESASNWADDLLIQAQEVRSGGSISSAVDDFLAGSDTLTFFNPENSFAGSRGENDVRIDPTVIKTLDVSEFTNLDNEKGKLEIYLETLTELGKTIIGNPLMCRILGIDESQKIEEDVSYGETSGFTAYPDLDLPKHPYYNSDDSLATNPDFYMWNLYEDGNGSVLGLELEQVKNAARLSMANSYNHLKRMQGGGIVSKTNRGITFREGMEEKTHRSVLAHQPEGSSMILHGANAKYNEEVGTYTDYEKIDKGQENILNSVDTTDYSEEEIEALKTRSQKLSDMAAGKNSYIPAIKLDNFDHNALDFRSVRDAQDYYNFFTKIASIESMFSTKQGYAGTELKLDSDGNVITSENEGTEESNPMTEYQSMFDFNSISKLCEDSAVDILAHTKTMRKAYPTFKLFFIEEDEQETRFRNFDDFYSYNGVKEMTINRDRETGIDTAIIILQNVSGVLDGTKKNSRVDVDFFDQKKTKETANYGRGNRRDQIFDSLLLRPGVNMQLRLGFSSDPKSLEVMISGCITDISWSKAGDLCELVVQSFGAELHQHIKGVSQQEEEKNTFPTTHHLLSSLLLSSELKHFGRWEFDQIYQYGETSNAKLDLFRYKRANRVGWFHFDWADSISSFFFDNVVAIGSSILATVAIGTAVILKKKPGAILNQIDDASKALTRNADELSGTTRVTDDAGLVIQSERVTLQSGKTVADDTAGASFNILNAADEAKVTAKAMNQIKGLFNLITPAALSNGNKNLFTKLNSGQFSVFRALSQLSLFKNNRIGTGMRWLGNAGNANKYLGYSDDVIKGVEELLKFKNANTIGAVDNFIKQADDVIELVKRGTGSKIGSKGVANSNKKLKEVLKSFTKGDKTLAQVVEAQQDVLVSLNKMNRANRLDSILNGALTKWSTPEGGVSAYGSAIVSGAWGAFTNVYVGSVLSGGTLIAASSLAAENIYKYTLKGIREDNKHYREEYARIRSSMLLEPQDDNIFPPNPMTYIRLEDKKEIESSWLLGLSNLIEKVDLVGLVDMTFGTAFEEIYKKFFEQKKKYQEKRVPYNKSYYRLNNSTIWSVFCEMTLRHPGWINAAVPYGHKFQYTKFFGVPSQRYWSKPAANSFVYRSNRLREFLTLDINTFSLKNIEDNWIRLYGKEDWEKAYRNASREGYTDLGKLYPIYNGVYERRSEEIGPNGVVSYFDNPYDDVDVSRVNTFSLGIKLKNKAMKEYLTGLESRFIPFRRYHIVDSEINLINNNIIMSNRNVVNAVAIHYKDEDNSSVEVLEMKSSSMLEDYEINEANVAEYQENIKSQEMAFRYGMGSLIYGMKDMYKGEVMVLGNPRIKPWDICYLFDNYNDMFGPFEVKAVTHIFSHETGFITEIVPNAVVVANEVSSTPVIDGLKLFIAAVRDKDKKAGITNKFISDYERSIIDGTFGIMDIRYGEDLKRKYRELVDQDVNFDTIWDQIPAEDKEILKTYTKEEIFEYLTGYATWQLKLAETVNFGLNTEGIAAGYDSERLKFGTIVGGTFGGVAAIEGYRLRLRDLNYKLGELDEILNKPEIDSQKRTKVQIEDDITKLKNKINKFEKGRFKFKGKTFVGVGLLSGVAGYFIPSPSETNSEVRKSLESKRISLSDELLDGDIKYLISSPILFSKFMEQEAVQVIPLVKGGNPIVTGMSLRDPMAFWQNTLGVLTNRLNDQMRGFADRSRMSLKYKEAFYQRFEELNNQVIDDLDKRTLVQDLLVEEGYSKDAVEIALSEEVTKWFKDIKRSL